MILVTGEGGTNAPDAPPPPSPESNFFIKHAYKIIHFFDLSGR